GDALERQSEPQPTPSPPHPSADQYETQPDPSPRPSPTIPIPNSIPEGSGGNHGAKIGRKEIIEDKVDAKGVSFDDLDDIVDDVMDYMESKDAQDEGRTSSVVLEEKESTQKGVSNEVEVSVVKPNGSTDKSKVSTDKPEVSTAKPKDLEVSTNKLDEGTTEPKDGTSDESAAPITEAEEEMKKLAEKEATKDALIQDFDDIQARIKADRLLVARLQEEKREKFTVKEQAKFLYDTIAAQRRFLAQQRATAIKSRPPIRTLLRNQMMIYLKHVGGNKYADLNNKNFEEIQVQYKKVKRSDKDFIAIGSAEDERQIKEMNEESKDPKKKRVVNETPREKDTVKVPAEQEVTEHGTKKRNNGHVKMINRKRPRPQPDNDSDDEHRKCLRIVTFESTIDSEIMETNSFVSNLHKVSSPNGDYLVVYRVNEHFKVFNYLMEVLHIFDRQDWFHLYDLVMKQYSEITLEGIELILWGDLKIMMESLTEENDKSDFWNNQQEWEVFRWRLYEACGVCIIELKDGTIIYRLVERRYTLSKELLQRMLDLGLEVKEEMRRVWVLANHHTTNGLQFTMSNRHQELTSPEAKDFWLSIYLAVYNEELAIPEQTAVGKGISNPLIAGSLPKTTKLT
ncbi:hypothetical protein Tco_1098695, partial [Tanacetum coccineum]